MQFPKFCEWGELGLLGFVTRFREIRFVGLAGLTRELTQFRYLYTKDTFFVGFDQENLTYFRWQKNAIAF